MTIEFRCSQCNQLLRVPDTAVGENARCPKCQALMLVPAPTGEAQPTSSNPAGDVGQLDGLGSPLSQPFAPPAAGGFGSPPQQPPAHPFGEAGANPFAGGPAAASTNPYAPPAAVSMLPIGPVEYGPIVPQSVPVEAIFNYSWQIWKDNLGLLVGITLIIAALNYAVTLPVQILQGVLQANKENEAAIAMAVVGPFLSNLIQLYLNIGHFQINLKLARRRPTTVGELFGGLPLFLPVLGAGILAFLGVSIGFVLCIVPGVLLLLAYWPFMYLIVDRRVPVLQSFSEAARITQGNWGNAFILWLMSAGISILGCLACFVGLLFAAPLVSMMWAVAYLMMSGQLSPYPAYQQPATYMPVK